MKPITKDTKVAVNVRKCTVDEKMLVIDCFRRLTGEGMAGVETASRIAKYIILNGIFQNDWSYSSGALLSHVKLISFKKFLKRINPYRGKKWYVESESEEQKAKIVKRLEKMGYNRFDGENQSYILFDGSMDYFLRYDKPMCSYTKLTFFQFMNLELPEKEEPDMLQTLKNLVNASCGDTMENFRIALADAKAVIKQLES